LRENNFLERVKMGTKTIMGCTRKDFKKAKEEAKLMLECEKVREEAIRNIKKTRGMLSRKGKKVKSKIDENDIICYITNSIYRRR